MGPGWKIRLREINAYNCPEPPLEPPDCWRDEFGEPEEQEYDRAEDELNGIFNR